MELKHELDTKTQASAIRLLIVPCGIETTEMAALKVNEATLLIVPCGIETGKFAPPPYYVRELLIVPCGIETVVLRRRRKPGPDF